MRRTHPYLFGSAVLLGMLLALALLMSIAAKGQLAFTHEGVIGVIEIFDEIKDSELIVGEIETMTQNEAVKGVVVRLDSPGGGVAPSQEIFDALNLLREVKPVYVSMGSVAASGAYYIACAADQIFANPGTITGSIGVVMEWVNVEGLAEKAGAKMITVKAGLHKDIGSMYRDLGEEERIVLQTMVDDTHSQFIDAVASGREKLSPERVRELSDGRIFNGRQAFEAGLVDGLAGYSEVVDKMADYLELSDPVRVIRIETAGGLFSPLESLLPLKQLAGLRKALPTPGVRMSYLLR